MLLNVMGRLFLVLVRLLLLFDVVRRVMGRICSTVLKSTLRSCLLLLRSVLNIVVRLRYSRVIMKVSLNRFVFVRDVLRRRNRWSVLFRSKSILLARWKGRIKGRLDVLPTSRISRLLREQVMASTRKISLLFFKKRRENTVAKPLPLSCS